MLTADNFFLTVGIALSLASGAILGLLCGWQLKENEQAALRVPHRPHKRKPQRDDPLE